MALPVVHLPPLVAEVINPLQVKRRLVRVKRVHDRRAKVLAVRVRAVKALVDLVVGPAVGSTSTTCLSGCRLFQSRMLRSATLSSSPVRRVSIRRD